MGLAETYLVGTPVWDLAKKVLHHDPLRGTPVSAPTVEILGCPLQFKEETVNFAVRKTRVSKNANQLQRSPSRFAINFHRYPFS
ncbi:hypothetical protein [Actinoplanes sp. NPDC049118]|uniref:hypothetical protein n=1 Tax=Actinoplanes sp. NPDC049118 TaxID=3155769 RepID=UPI0033CD34E0